MVSFVGIALSFIEFPCQQVAHSGFSYVYSPFGAASIPAPSRAVKPLPHLPPFLDYPQPLPALSRGIFVRLKGIFERGVKDTFRAKRCNIG